MALELIRVYNTSLHITNEISYPVIKVVVSGSGAPSNELWDQIHALAIGSVAGGAFYSAAVAGVDPLYNFSDIPSSQISYGSNSGFVLTVERGPQQNKLYNVILKFKNYPSCSNVTAFTGYGTYEASFTTIFVDENDNLYTPTGTTNSTDGLYILTTENVGPTIRYNKFAAAAVPPGNRKKRLDGYPTLVLRNDSISSFIDGESDPSEPGEDPYKQGGNTGPGGGTGTFDGTGDDVDIPSLPTLSAVDTGFITIFNPSATQLKDLANYMWSTGFDLNTFKKLFADPMDCILGMSIVPVNVPSGSSKTVSVGNISTGVSMTTASSQYVELDCGSLNVQEFWGAYLDYDPYTKAEIYLPYIGTHPLAVDDIMAKTVKVVYHIDILSGACTAFVKCGGSVLYEFIGQCSSSIPITGNDWTNVINGVITIAGAIGSMVATGGATAPMAVGAIASSATNSLKPNVEKSGSMSGTGGMLGVQTPYLILTRPRQAIPENQNLYEGYPSFITSTLDSLKGFTKVHSIHLENIPATQAELMEIENLLKSGVII